jgi:hypothetical protein
MNYYLEIVKKLEELGFKRRDIKEFDVEYWSVSVGKGRRKSFINIRIDRFFGVVDIIDLYHGYLHPGIPYERFLKNIDRYKAIKTVKKFNS